MDADKLDAILERLERVKRRKADVGVEIAFPELIGIVADLVELIRIEGQNTPPGSNPSGF